MRTDDFDFELPAGLIAQRPVQPRDAARLLRVTSAGLLDSSIGDLAAALRPGDLLVFNDTKVVPARLAGRRGAVAVSVTLHQALENNIWRAFAKPGKRLKPGDRIDFTDDFSAIVQAKHETGDITLAFTCPDEDLPAALHRHGAIPLPPYIRGGVADDRDQRDYQTVFAENPGAVAAPTAALHFTPDLLARLDRAGIERTTLTLHVGAGTFLPVKADDPAQHVMHAETGILSEATADRINTVRAAGGRIIAVGTTALRLLETAAESSGRVRPFAGSTQIFITPGYRFKAVDMLLTNFHLPRSTLFMLVAAFAGLARMQEAYAHAKAQGYRFYSYGDASLLERAAL